MMPATPQRSRRAVASTPPCTRNTLLIVPEISASLLLKHQRLGDAGVGPLAARQHLLEPVEVLQAGQRGFSPSRSAPSRTRTPSCAARASSGGQA